MASTAGTVHTLDDFIFSQGAAVKLTGYIGYLDRSEALLLEFQDMR